LANNPGKALLLALMILPGVLLWALVCPKIGASLKWAFDSGGCLGTLTGICWAGFVRSWWSGFVGWIRTHFNIPLTSIFAGEIDIGEFIKSGKRIYSLYDIGKTDR